MSAYTIIRTIAPQNTVSSGESGLESLTKALQRDKDASGSASDAIHVFRDQFELDVDRLIRQYEEVILELAAYVPIKQIRDRVVNDDFTVTELQTAGQKFTSYDNEVKDATVRAAFMLPPIQ
jgi:endo-1,4-beta-mannosidase